MKLTDEKFSLGIISDTHNLLRPEAYEKLKGSDLIIHAGDVGERKILNELEKLAPVIAVRGNVDRAQWCLSLPLMQTVIIGEIKIHIIHNLKELDIDPQSEGVRAIISGHSHKPHIEKRDDVLFINPGSAGKRRFNLPITLALMKIDNQNIEARILELL